MHLRQRTYPAFVLGVCLLLSWSCATVRYEQSLSSSTEEITELKRRLVINPDDVDAMRDLGVVYFRTKHYPEAKDFLERASSSNTQDAKTLFFLGMTNENLGDRNRALTLYSEYAEFSGLSPYRKLMEGRYRGLTREIIQEQFHDLVQRESTLGKTPLTPNTVAVFPLAFLSGEPRYATLGLGLSEMITIDLAQVKRLTVVERIRVEALLDELKFGTSSAVDQTTAPRLGKLLTAGRLVSGTVAVTTDRSIRTDVAAYTIGSKKATTPTSSADNLDNFFALQKDIVFAVLKEMGITPARAERENILRTPTRSLQAFIAYSIGLEKEDQGDFTAATVYYRQAASLDPNFSQAQSRAEAADALSLAGTGVDQAYASAQRLDPSPLRASTDGGFEGLMMLRFGHMEESIGSGFYPGQDNRNGPQEAASGGAAVGSLPPPPGPPR